MGAMQNNPGTNNKGSKKRGSVNNGARLEAFARERKSGAADWGSCYAEKLQAAVVGITSMGGAITFGMSRDQGAHSLTLLLDGEKQTLWFNGGADLNEELDGVVATLASMV